MTALNILASPQAIYNAVKPSFPKAEVRLNISLHSPVEMTLTLSQQINPLILTTSIDASEFTRNVGEIFNKIKADRLLNIPHTYTLDKSYFTVESPLSDWQEFQREKYEQEGQKTCVDAILSYLKNPNEPSDLISLGLFPNQVDANPTNEEIAYFRIVSEKIGSMENPDKKQAVDNFSKNYPLIFRIILKELKKQNLEENKEAPDVHQEILGKLKKAVVGQNQAVEELASFLASQKNDIGKNQVFLFVGPTGVGKTELAKAVASIKQNRWADFRMNQYPDESHVSTFFGSASGYVGSTDKPHFAKALEEKCNPTKKGSQGSTLLYEITDSVLLFDELEKAHAKLKQSLLTLFDEGFCKISYTPYYENISIKYIFKNCVIINTSNLYQEEILEAFHQNRPPKEISAHFKELNLHLPLPSSYSQELLARMNIIPFGPIPRGEIYQSILKRRMNEFFEEIKKEFSFKAVEAENEGAVLLLLENELYGKGVDLRKIPQYFLKLKPTIHTNKSKWGPLHKIKIVFYCEHASLYFKTLTFIETFNFYENVDIISFETNVNLL